jgi:hypothetical protein
MNRWTIEIKEIQQKNGKVKIIRDVEEIWRDQTTAPGNGTYRMHLQGSENKQNGGDDLKRQSWTAIWANYTLKMTKMGQQMTADDGRMKRERQHRLGVLDHHAWSRGRAETEGETAIKMTRQMNQCFMSCTSKLLCISYVKESQN